MITGSSDKTVSVCDIHDKKVRFVLAVSGGFAFVCTSFTHHYKLKASSHRKPERHQDPSDFAPRK
eukprot:1384601-Amorphochlora_amoeboformis.AAC.3